MTMKSFIPILFITISLTSCISQEKKREQEKNSNTMAEVYFSLASYGDVENPNELNNKTVSISINENEINEIVSIYENDKLLSEQVKKISDTPKKYVDVINSIPDNFLKNRIFGHPNMADEGSLGVTLVLENGEQVFWEVSFRKNELPEEIQDVYKIYDEVQQKFNIQMNPN